MAVVLGAPGEAFSDAATLLDHGFEAFTERTFVDGRGTRHGSSDPGGAVPEGVGAERSRRSCRSPRTRTERSSIVVARRGLPAGAGGARRHG